MRKYAIVMDGTEVAATFDDTGQYFDKLKKVFQGAGYTVKEVSREEYVRGADDEG